METIGARMGGSLVGSKSGFLNDTAPHIPAAGKVTAITGESTARCLEYEERPITPPEQRRFRQSAVHEPAQIVRHPGRAMDPLKEGPFGRPSIQPEDEGVQYSIKQMHDSDVRQWIQERSEDVYASKRQEPLGKSMLRGHNIPERVQEDGFGRKIHAKYLNSIGQAHAIIFPAEGPVEETDEDKERYRKTHGNFGPGEQRQRGYDWNSTGVDPGTHAFGIKDKINLEDGVAKALNPNLDSVTAEKTKIITKDLADFKITNTDYLGQTRNLGHGDRQLPESHVFGKPTRTFVEWDAGRLISGDYSKEEQEPDTDLGRSIRPGYRNIAPEERIFGTPSIRTDLPHPKGPGRSIADNNNYGNEPSASHLLTPGVGANYGVSEEEYVHLRTKEELQDLMADAGIEFSGSAEFDAAFDMAVTMCGSADTCSVETLLHAKQHLLRSSAGLQ